MRRGLDLMACGPLPTLLFYDSMKELAMFSLEKAEGSHDSTLQILGRLSHRGGPGSLLDHPRVQDTEQWAQVTGSQILAGHQEKVPNC